MSRQVLNEQTFAPGSPLTATRTGERTMTVEGTIAKAFLFLVVTVVFAALGWRAAANVLVQSGLWFFLGYILLIALTFAAAANPRLAAGAGLLYAVLMGTWMGAISRLYEHYYDGVVGLAIFVTLAVFLACLVLYLVRAVRVTGRFVQVVLIATLGVGLVYLFGWILSLFGVDLLFWSDPGNPVGIAISLVIVVIAALNLLVDFSYIEQGVRNGAPASMEWYAAFGLLTTLVWLYIEVLRLLIRVRANQ
jgi:uncharacterized YccA/Bax inhibitor family protein